MLSRSKSSKNYARMLERKKTKIPELRISGSCTVRVMGLFARDYFVSKYVHACVDIVRKKHTFRTYWLNGSILGSTRMLYVATNAIQNLITKSADNSFERELPGIPVGTIIDVKTHGGITPSNNAYQSRTISVGAEHWIADHDTCHGIVLGSSFIDVTTPGHKFPVTHVLVGEKVHCVPVWYVDCKIDNDLT